MATKPLPQAALINLTKSIALAESGNGSMTPNYNAVGDNGTSKGAYQFNGDNYETWAKQYGVDPSDFSPANQNKVALARVTDLYNQGLSPAQIAAAWNMGEAGAKDGSWQTNVGTTSINGKDIAYDTPAYVKKVNGIYGQLSGQAPGTGAPDPAAAPGGVTSWITGAIKGAGEGVGNDFKSLANLPSALLHPSNPDFWSTIGGSVNALSDVAMVGGIVVGDIATGGADIPADPAELAGGIAARDAAEKGAGAALKTGLQKTVGRFAAGKGVGLVAQGATSAASSFAQAKQKGASTGSAATSAAAAAATTMATFGLMNKLGPKVSNGFINLVSKTKFAGFVKDSLNAAADYIKSSSSMGTLKEAGEAAKTKLNAAAEQIVSAGMKALGGMTASLKTPTASETGALVQKVSSNVSETGNKQVEGVFQKALTALSKFTLSKDDIGDIVKNLPSAGTSKDDLESQIQAEQERLVKSGGPLPANDPTYRGQAEATVKGKAAADALASDAEATVAQRSQALVSSIAAGGKATVQEIINGLNIKTPEAVEATLTSSWWQAIRAKVGSSEEGKAALQAYTDAMTARAKQSEQATFADTMRHSVAGGWERVTSSVFNMLKDGGSVDNLKKAFGEDFGSFQKNLTQKIMADATRAYQHVVAGANGKITPEVSDAAHKAMSSVVDSYNKKLADLPGLLSSKTIGFLGDMKNGIPTVQSMADQLGVDGSKVMGEDGKPLLAQGEQAATQATQQALDTVRNSPIGKILDSGNFSKLPDAVLGASKEEIAATKQILGADSDEWKAIGAGALGNIMKKVTGLFGNSDKDAAEDFLKQLSLGVGGDKEKYEMLFGGDGVKGKNSPSALIEGLTDYANAIRSGSKTTGMLKAAGAVFAYTIHHPYMAAMLAKDSADEFLSTEDSKLLKSLASKSPTQIRAEFNKQAADQGGISGFMAKVTNIVTRLVGPAIKYGASQKLGQTAGSSI